MYAGSEAESGTASDLLLHPHHPYTQGLISALPGVARQGKVLTTIGGSPPELGNFPAGCAFHERCAYAQASCSLEVPSVLQVSDNHRIFCPINPLTEKSVKSI